MRLSHCYIAEGLNEPIEQDWYKILRAYMRVASAALKTSNLKIPPLIFAGVDSLVEESHLDDVLETVFTIIDDCIPESEREKYKQRYRDRTKRRLEMELPLMHQELANKTSNFCYSLLSMND